MTEYYIGYSLFLVLIIIVLLNLNLCKNTKSLLDPHHILRFNKYKCIELIPDTYTKDNKIIFRLKVNKYWYGTTKANKWIFNLYNDDANYLFYRVRHYITAYINSNTSLSFIDYLMNNIIFIKYSIGESFTYDNEYIYIYSYGILSKPMYCIRRDILEEFKNNNTDNERGMYIYED